MKMQTNVLFMSSNPYDTPHLQVIREAEVIRESIKMSPYRDYIRFYPYHLTTIDKLRRALLETDFDIVHISGHGTDIGIVLEKDDGTSYIVPQEALAELFHAHSPPLQCVILNSCFSISQGRLISMGIPFTVGMDGRVNDLAAIEFSRGFYDAIGAGRNIDFAYEEGCRTVRLKIPEAQFESVILRGGGNKIATINLSSHDTIKRIKAARWLGVTRQEASIPLLTEHLQTENDPEVRYWVIVAIGQMGGNKSRTTLAQLHIRFDTDKLAIQDAMSLNKRLS